MLIYKQRYKPRTTREFTKSDLTVYDSAGNTALNALTVYGKSEVVDGAITSAGEGWATVDLGTLNYVKTSRNVFRAQITSKNPGVSPLLCSKYEYTPNTGFDVTDKHISDANSASYPSSIFIYDTDYINYDTADFKTAMSGILLCYQLADPTQGNAIAIKTDDGTDINGTMATFSTSTPLRGIPDTDVRGFMAWDGSAGEVTNVCSDVDLGTLNWTRSTDREPYFYSAGISSVIKSTPNNQIAHLLIAKYTATSRNELVNGIANNVIAINNNGTIQIRDTAYTDPTDFKTAMSGVMLVYELATPTTEQLTSTENASIAGLRTFATTTHAQNNAQTDMTVDYTIRVPTI